MFRYLGIETDPLVALRKESVDRNVTLRPMVSSHQVVALRKESVDRNVPELVPLCSVVRRSPQGERG